MQGPHRPAAVQSPQSCIGSCAHSLMQQTQGGGGNSASLRAQSPRRKRFSTMGGTARIGPRQQVAWPKPRCNAVTRVLRLWRCR